MSITPLASKSDPEVGKTVTATGWGKLSDASDSRSDHLMYIDVPILSNEKCHGFYDFVNDGHICIDSTYGGVCNVIIFCSVQFHRFFGVMATKMIISRAIPEDL